MNSLLKEIKFGNTEKVIILLNKGVLKEDSQWTDYRLLKSAIQLGKIEIAKLLIERGFRVNRKPNLLSEDTPLHLAIYQNDSDLIELLLKNNASLEYRNKNKDTPVTLAAKLHKDAVVESFLSRISHKNCVNTEGLSHMHIACMRNHTQIVKKFLQNGESIDHRVDSKSSQWAGYTPLHFAVEFKCLATVQTLLNNGASIIITDSRERTPLHLAFLLHREEIIDAILRCHIYESENPLDLQNLSHFHIACTRNDVKIVETFLQYKTKFSINELFGTVSNESLYYAGYSALHFAIENECVDVVELLLVCDIDIGTNSCNNISPISLAYQTGNTEIIELILNRCEKKCTKINVKHNAESFQFLAACMNDTCEIVYSLINCVEINQAIDQDSPTWPGWTALHLAVKHENVEIIEFLIQNGADINIKNVQEKTPLHLAFDSNQEEVTDLLLTNFEKLRDNPTDSQGLSHFHIICTRNNVKAIKHFLNLGVNINASVKFDSTFWPGFTPLHFAVKYNRREVIKLLLSYGADVRAKNEIGLTPFDLAIEYCSKAYDKGSYQPEINYATVKLLLLEHDRRNVEPIYNRGFTLLHIACALNDLNLIGRTLNKESVNQTTDYNLPIWGGYTALHFAAYHNKENAIAVLDDYGCDISIKNADGSTPLHLNWRYHGPFSPSLVNKCLIWCQGNPIGPDGISHFHIACARDNLLAFTFFSRYVDVNQPTNFDRENNSIPGATPLHLASSKDIVQKLLESGANYEARDARLQTPLHGCFLNRDRAKIDLLAEAGADVNALDEFRRTPLIIAIENLECVELEIINAFLENGADVNIEARNGKTAMTIDIFTFDDYPEIMAVLMKHVKRLQMLGFYLSDKIEFIYRAESRVLETDGHYKEADFVKQCEDEIEKLDSIHIDQYTSLFDIMIKHSNEMYRHVNNETFIAIVNSAEFGTEFPVYGYLLKLQLRKGVKRRELLQSARDSLEILAHRKIHDDILDTIIIYLDDYDLKKMINSTSHLNKIVDETK